MRVVFFHSVTKQGLARGLICYCFKTKLPRTLQGLGKFKTEANKTRDTLIINYKNKLYKVIQCARFNSCIKHQMVQLGHIIRDSPTVIGCLGLR